LSRVETRQLAQRIVQHQDLAVGRWDRSHGLVKGHTNAPRTLGGLTLARVIDEDTPHELRRQREELGPIHPAYTSLLYQTDVRFVHERGGLQCVIWTLAT
jgi:hypothetical protein